MVHVIFSGHRFLKLPAPAPHPVSNDASALTTAEALIWAGQRLAPQSPLYNMALALDVAARLDVTTLRQALEQLTREDEVLRTVIREVGGQPHRQVLDRADVDFTFVDRSQDAMSDGALQQLLEQWTGELLPLSGPLWRVRVIACRPDRTLLYITQHHLTADAMSVTNLFKRWGARYARLLTGSPEQLREPPRFADHLAEVRRLQQSPKLIAARAFWEESATAQRVQPSVYGHHGTGSGRTRRVRLTLGADRAARLARCAASPPFRGLTDAQSRYVVFATVLAAWLHRVSDADDVAIGTPWHNRASARLRDSLGLFIELYPLRVALSAGESWASLAAKVSGFTMQAARHVVPGASSARGARAFPVVLNYITADLRDFAGQPAAANWVHSGHGDPQHALRLQVHDFGVTGSPTLDFDLDLDVFDELAQGWAVDHFLCLLDALLDDPHGTIADVPLVTWEDEARFAPRGTEHDAPDSVLVAIEAQAARAPDAVALIDGNRTVSYRQLMDSATVLAESLAYRGIGPGHAVGLLLERSAELVVAILGVLKAGAAYVPLDPDQPDERLGGILQEAELDLTITAPGAEQRVQACGGDPSQVHPLRLSDSPQAISASAPPHPGPDALAYVLYTSGSTGTPKGVEVTHAALADYVAWAARSYTDGSPTRFPFFTSPAFDLTVTSIFTPLVTGGAVVVYRSDEAGGALLVRRVFAEDQVDVVKLTPAHLGLIRDLDLSASRVQRLILGGENLTTAVAARAHEAFGGRVEIFNEYGPTEATVGCMVHRYAPDQDTGDSVPIGVPADNVRIHVLDPVGQPVPRGCRGEIHIGGRRLARGYRANADRTREAFVSVPGAPDRVLYKTGDEGRWDAQGRLDFLGRTDGQVKLRGVRMELGEIESALQRYPGIHDVALHVVRAAPVSDRHCRVCGLEGAHPEAHLGNDDLCAVCRRFEQERDKVSSYFGTMNDLGRLLAQARQASRGAHDTLMLLSGGKDSTYALCKIVEMGARPLVFMLDNGFISDQAKSNARRVVDQLGLELVIGETPAMPAIFAESLTRYSNVCNGCFKVIYTLAMNLAAERGIPAIVTGLSRGQIFETRLADLYRRGVYDPTEVDRTILAARKTYHRMDDAVSRSMDTRIFDTDDVLDSTQFIDFYRYCNVDLEELLAYVGQHTPWIRPADTGRSTNCLINQAGIFVHQSERGFHNYTLPYSWDVRLGHKERGAVLAELDDDLDLVVVQRMLDDVGYRGRPPAPPEARLIAYYTSDQELSVTDLRDFLGKLLPAEAVPAGFVRLDRIPLTANGKVDRRALPQPAQDRPILGAPYVAPKTEVEERLVAIWCEVLGRSQIGTEDDFFELGGDSMHSIQIVSLARDRGLRVEPRDLFAHPTVAGLATVTETCSTPDALAAPEASTLSAAELAELEAEFGAG